jgi:hypothetical protein
MWILCQVGWHRPRLLLREDRFARYYRCLTKFCSHEWRVRT